MHCGVVNQKGDDKGNSEQRNMPFGMTNQKGDEKITPDKVEHELRDG